MEPWFLIGLLGFALHGVTATIDKHMMNLKSYPPVETGSFKMLFNSVLLFTIAVLFFKLEFSREVFFLALLLGAAHALQVFMYFMLLKRKDVEVVTPYLKSWTILFVFITAVLVFSDPTTPWNWLGLAFVILGIYCVLSPDGFALPKVDKALWLVVMSAILHTMYVILAKFALMKTQPVMLLLQVYLFAAVFLFGYDLFAERSLKAFRPEFKLRGIFLSSLTSSIAILLTFTALSLGDASKVYTMSGLKPVVVFLIATTLLHEKFSWHRLLGTGGVVAGIALVAI